MNQGQGQGNIYHCCRHPTQFSNQQMTFITPSWDFCLDDGPIIPTDFRSDTFEDTVKRSGFVWPTICFHSQPGAPYMSLGERLWSDTQ